MTRHPVPARAWSPRTAWAALELMTGGAAAWMESSQRSRLRRELADLDPERVVSKLRNRAEVRSYRVNPTRVPLVEAEVALVGPGDGYVDESVLHRLISEQQMVRVVPGNITLRVLPADVGQDFAAMVISHGDVVAGVDLMTSDDPAQRRAGEDMVAAALEWVR